MRSQNGLFEVWHSRAGQISPNRSSLFVGIIHPRKPSSVERGISGHGADSLISQWGSTIKSPWVPTVTSQYSSWWPILMTFDVTRTTTNKHPGTTLGHIRTGTDSVTVHSWPLYSAAPLGDKSTSTMTWIPTQSHYPNIELTWDDFHVVVSYLNSGSALFQ